MKLLKSRRLRSLKKKYLGLLVNHVVLKYNLPKLIPVSCDVLGPPKGVYYQMKDWIQKWGKDVEWVKVHPKTQYEPILPKTIENLSSWITMENCDFSWPETSVTVIPKGRVYEYRRRGYILTPDQHIIEDHSNQPLYHHPFIPNPEQRAYDSLYSIFLKPKLTPVRKIAGQVAVVHANSWENYSHWCFDILPKLQILKEAGYDWKNLEKIVVPDIQFAFQRESLDLLGIRPEQCLTLSRGQHIQADQLIVPSMVSPIGQTPEWAVDFLRENLLSNTKNLTNIYPEKIYISRSKCKYRLVLNEAEIFNYLEELGYQKIYLEDLSVEQQILTFYHAKWIVSPHGAGLTNLVYCQPGATIIEFFSPRFACPTYYLLSIPVHLNYYYLFGEGPQHDNPTDYILELDKPGSGYQDILLNPDKLKETLSLAVRGRHIVSHGLDSDTAGTRKAIPEYLPRAAEYSRGKPLELGFHLD